MNNAAVLRHRRATTGRFQTWVDAGPFTALDVGRYRVVYAFLALLTLPEFFDLAKVSNTFFDPPPGPFRLFSGFPSAPFLWTLEVLLALALAALLFGWHVRFASLLAFTTMLIGYGFVYSTGKIDHNIFFIVTPLLLSFARWGDAVAVAPPHENRLPGGARVRQWPLRYLALLLGVGFATASAQKALSGWLDPATHAAEGYVLSGYLIDGKTGWLEVPLARISPGWLWEPLDWATVLVEGGVILCVLRWRSFRAALAVITVFHVCVLLSMNIWFAPYVYAAFVPWGRLPWWPDLPEPAVRRLARLAPVLVAATAAAALGLNSLWWSAEVVVSSTLTILGGLVGAGYLAWAARGVLTGVRQRRPG